MLFKRRPTMPREPLPVLDGFGITCKEDLMTVNGGARVEGRAGSELVLGYGQGGVSRASFRTQPGARWLSTSTVMLAEEGDLLPVRFGPMFYDEKGTIIEWWPGHEPDVSAGKANLRVESVAPEGAALVRLGMLGPWRKNVSTTAAFRFSGAMMARQPAPQP